MISVIMPFSALSTMLSPPRRSNTQYWQNLRGKKVHIFANHNGIVSKVPQIVGDWPKGITGEDFEAWLLEAGSPPIIL